MNLCLYLHLFKPNNPPEGKKNGEYNFSTRGQQSYSFYHMSLTTYNDLIFSPGIPIWNIKTPTEIYRPQTDTHVGNIINSRNIWKYLQKSQICKTKWQNIWKSFAFSSNISIALNNTCNANPLTDILISWKVPVIISTSIVPQCFNWIFLPVAMHYRQDNLTTLSTTCSSCSSSCTLQSYR